MYETIVITKILMHFCIPKGEKASILYYFPSPAIKEIYVLCKKQYVLSRKYRWAYKSITTHP